MNVLRPNQYQGNLIIWLNETHLMTEHQPVKIVEIVEIEMNETHLMTEHQSVEIVEIEMKF